jgi:hypothetical protein
VVTRAAAAAELAGWEPPDEAQRALKYALLAFLDARPADACDRSCVPGHLTASALVLDAAGEHVLLTLHPRVGRWIQLGGALPRVRPNRRAAGDQRRVGRPALVAGGRTATGHRHGPGDAGAVVATARPG